MRRVTSLAGCLLALGLSAVVVPAPQLAAAEAGAAEEAKEAKAKPIKGTLVSATAEAVVVTVDGAEEPRTIALAEGAKLSLGRDEVAPADIAAGSKVVVKLDQDGKAVEVKVHKPKPEGEDKGKDKGDGDKPKKEKKDKAPAGDEDLGGDEGGAMDGDL